MSELGSETNGTMADTVTHRMAAKLTDNVLPTTQSSQSSNTYIYCLSNTEISTVRSKEEFV